MEVSGRPTRHARTPVTPLDAAEIRGLQMELEKIGVLSEEPHGW